ncbi:hypothetical protein SCACP_26000 [Sporomusa carbonis]|jgi:hypothetical protein|uniref:rRNA biogenesis protein rrp5 n=1 Tax=Sporomusa carbonis TaxID=3076075 RepID=UPI003A64BD86
MSKSSDLSIAVAELKRCGEALIGISAALADYFSATNDAEKMEQPTAKTPAPEEKLISLEMVRAVLAEKSRAGYTAEVRALLEKHGASKLSEIDPTKYSTLLKEAEVLENG